MKIEHLAVPTAEEAKGMPPIEALARFGPLIIMVLKLVKVFTGEKADEKIDACIDWLTSLNLFGL